MTRRWSFVLSLVFPLVVLVSSLGPRQGVAAETRKVVIQPACVVPFSFTDAAVKQLPDNTGPQCTNWTVAYAASGFTTLNLSVQTASDAGNAPGAWVDWPGTVVSGIQPNTATDQASTQLAGYYRWVRINLSGLTGSGNVTGVLYGKSNVTHCN